MADRKFYSIEKNIADALKEGSSGSVPPFADIAGRIAAGEPQESFEEFFAGEIVPVRNVRQNKKTSWKVFAGAAAAVLVLFIGGAAALGVFMSSARMEAKSTADDMFYDSLERNDSKSLENAAAEDGEYLQDKVSDSDLDDSEQNASSEP